MSVINKMLQELDRRNATPADGAVAPGAVRTVRAPRRRHEWFWRIVAAQLLVAVGWVGWVAWQLQPQPSLATDAGLRAAASARQAASAPMARSESPAPQVPVQPAPPVQPSQAPATAAAAPPAVAAPAAPAPATAPTVAPAPAPAPAAESAAPALTPPRAEVAAAAKAPPSRAAPAAAPAAVERAPKRLDLDLPQAKILAEPPARAARVEKRDTRPPAARAEAEYRRAVSLLNQARVSEAEEIFHAALGHDATHEEARQALVSLLLQRNRVEEARRLMQEGLAMNPGSVTLAIGLARLLASRRDYASALDALRGAQAAGAGRDDYHALAGTLLQRMGRHKEAVDSYASALKIAPASGNAWVGMAISLEALERRSEAAESFRRALGTGSLAAEVRDYAEQRARSLQ